MVRQAMTLGPVDARVNVGTVAALLAFCSPYPVRFAIERKSYALLVLLVALAWWWRRSSHLIGYGVMAGLAGMTHFYGLFLVSAEAAWDGWRRRWSFSAAALIGALPALAWIVYAANYLFSSRAASWIGPPDYALFEETLARGLGLWPLPKLGLILLLVVVFRRWGGLHRLSWPERGVMDRSGLIPSLLMVVGVVVVSFVKPMAFSRYFVVLLPVVVPVLAVQFGALNLNRLGRGCAVGVLASCWPVVGGQVFPNWILLWEECVNRISSVWSANAPLALWSVMARGPVCSISAIVWKLPWVGSHRIPCPGVMPTIWRSVWQCRRCLWSFGWPAVDLHRPWSASSNPCSHKLCRLVTTVNKLRTTSVMRGCCVADLKPWAGPSELSGGFAGACQQQGATGLWVHQQFEQGRRRGIS